MGHVITFAQQKGGAGKTTVLAHLAVAAALSGEKVALIDLDPQQSLSHWANLRADPALDRIESKSYRAAGDMKQAARRHDLVLVDCPGTESSLLDNVLRETDIVITPCQPSMMDVWASRSVLAAAKRFDTRCCVLLNRVPPRLGSLDAVLAALDDAGATVLETRLGNRNGYSQAMLTGRTAPEIAPRSPAAAEIDSLRAELGTLLLKR